MLKYFIKYQFLWGSGAPGILLNCYLEFIIEILDFPTQCIWGSMLGSTKIFKTNVLWEKNRKKRDYVDIVVILSPKIACILYRSPADKVTE